MIKKITALFLVLIVFLCSSCTYGRITRNGEGVANARVRILTCESVGNNNLITNTDSQGIYSFNPFLPNSPVLDLDNYVPTGKIAIAVSGNPGSAFERRDHEYNSSCPLTYNGSTIDAPCQVENIDLIPGENPDVFQEMQAFYAEDCGVQDELAEQLSTLAVTSLGVSLPLTSEPLEIDNLSQCVNSCIQEDIPVSKYASCMCNCVESKQGKSFGSFCTKPDIALFK